MLSARVLYGDKGEGFGEFYSVCVLFVVVYLFIVFELLIICCLVICLKGFLWPSIFYSGLAPDAQILLLTSPGDFWERSSFVFSFFKWNEAALF